MKIDNVVKLRKWLIKQLDPLCATADATANYILTLLKKDTTDLNELRIICGKELTTFLKERTDTFVHNLFEVLRGT